jgi:hypothetical protein
MRQARLTAKSAICALIFGVAMLLFLKCSGYGQSSPFERTFTNPESEVQNAIKAAQPTSGRLPVLDGFARPGNRPLDRFQRGYYQCAIQVGSSPTGGSVVRVSAKITAWYNDPATAKSGYEELPSNGRLETDLLDRIEESLGGKGSAPPASPRARSSASPAVNQPTSSAPALEAPMPNDPAPSSLMASKSPGTPTGSRFKLGSGAGTDRVASLATQKAVADKHMTELTQEAKNLAEILRNQAHPTNLVAVKKSETPVLVSPIEGAKVLFLATAEDEFEILDQNANWVHIRISGLSRGWIRRSSLEVPGPTASPVQAESDLASASAERFQVKDEQTATFPRVWEPLGGKTVRILTVQKTGANPANTGPKAKLEFTKSLFEMKYNELTQTATSAAGVVVIFDSEDGGMAAATLSALQQWKAGTLSDQAFWRRCFFDPPEAFGFQSIK